MITIGKYYLDPKKLIGQGSFSKVYYGEEKNNNKSVSIKVISLKEIEEYEKIEKEVEILIGLEHPNLLKMYDFYKYNDMFYIITEYCKGNLKQIEIKNMKKTLLEIGYSIQYLHHKNILHRDIKMENILIDFNDNVKICDFGFAKYYDKNNLKNTICGTITTVAPEVLKGGYYDKKIDLWSLGMVIYELIYQINPFETFQDVLNKEIKFPENNDKELIDLLKCLLKREVNERYGIDEYLNHPYFKKEEFEIVEKEMIQNNYQCLIN